jgi:glycosyltransferase involved in cell wall biosynthesis
LSLRVLVDGRNLSLSMGTGVATYARNVCGVLSDNGHHVDVLYGEPFGFHSNPLFREIAFFDAKPPKRRGSAMRELSMLLSPLKAAEPFEIPVEGTVVTREFNTRLPKAAGFWNAQNLFYNAEQAFALPYRLSRKFNTVANRTGSDIAHWTYPLPIRLRGACNIYTVHDLVPLRLPFTTLDRKRAYYRMIENICRDADAIVTVSEHSRKDVLDLFDVDSSKVFNTYQSVEIPDTLLDIWPNRLAADLLGTHGLVHREYILFYGAIEPKKNVTRLIEAYLASGLTIPLIIVGKDGWLYEGDPILEPLLLEKKTRIVERDESGRPTVHRLNYASFPQLISLIRGARMVAMPSLYEGFGLPIVEAMICGTPVLTSDVGATAEIAGDAALLVDPYDVRSIRDGLVALCSDPERAMSLARSGLDRAREFSPDKHAERLLPVYRSALDRRSERPRR